MLEFLRKKKVQKKILIALAAIIIPAFVLFGAGNLGGKRIAGSSFVGIIENKKISIDDFFQARRGTNIQLILSYLGQKEVLDTVMKDRNLMNKLTWDRIVMLRAAEKQGIDVTDEEVVRFITTHPLFVNNGLFDEKFYNYIVSKNLGINTRTFEEEIRSSLKISKLKDFLLKDILVTDKEVIDAYKRDFEKIKMTYLRIDNEKFKGAVDINGTDIDSYYASRKAEFIIPDRLNIEYIEFPYENLAEKDALQRTVNMLYKTVRKNPDKFDDIAEEHNREVKETGEFFRGNSPSDFRFDTGGFDNLFNKDVGSIDILFSEGAAGSVYIVRVKEKIASKIKSKEEVASIIEDDIRKERTQVLAKDKSEEVYKTIQEEKLSLETASAKYDLELSQTEFITRFGYVEGVGEAYGILEEMFKTRPMVASEPFKTRKGYIIARVDIFQEIDEERFKKEKQTYKNKVLAAKKTKVLTKWFTGISQNAHLKIDLRHL